MIFKLSPRMSSLVCWGLFGLMSFIIAYFFAIYSKSELPTQHLDGAFQTYSGLSRLHSGEVFGRDFFPYLGVGVTSLFYPIFLVLGANFGASVFSSYVVLMLTGVLSTTVIFRVCIPSISTVACAMSALVCISLFSLFRYEFSEAVWFLPSSVLDSLMGIFRTGNSLRPVRSFLPYLVAGFLLWACLRFKGWKLVLAFAVAMGICPLWSNDYGIPVLGMICLTWFGISFSGGISRKTVKAFLTGGILGVVCAAGFLFLVTAGHPGELLSYNFRDVRGDQYWYFGPWHGEGRIFSFWEIVPKVYEEVGVSFFLLPVVFLLWLRNRTLEDWFLFFLGASLFGGALVATVGGHLDWYFSPYMFWSKLVACILVTKALFQYFKWDFTVKNGRVLLVSLMLLLTGLAAYSLRDLALARQKTVAERSAAPLWVDSLGGFLPASHAGVVQRLETLPKTATVLEEYWGLWGAVRGKHSSPPVDSVIHALGSQRDAFLRHVKTHPDYVVTSSWGARFDWVTWSMAYNWWFWREVLQNYTLEGEYGTTWLWQKQDRPVVWNEVPLSTVSGSRVYSGQPVCEVDVPAPGFYEIVVPSRFVLSSPRVLGMLKGNVVKLQNSEGYQSLDPKLGEICALVYFSKAGVNPVFLEFWGEKHPTSFLEILGPGKAFQVEVPAEFVHTSFH